nr:unnamed protein product [Spirometra erinaceieuropaei]
MTCFALGTQLYAIYFANRSSSYQPFSMRKYKNRDCRDFRSTALLYTLCAIVDAPMADDPDRTPNDAIQESP